MRTPKLVIGGLLVAATLVAPSAAGAAQDVPCGNPGGLGFQCRYERVQEPGMRYSQVFLYFNGIYRGYVSASVNLENGARVVNMCDRRAGDSHGPGARLDMGNRVIDALPPPDVCIGVQPYALRKFRGLWAGHSTQWLPQP